MRKYKINQTPFTGLYETVEVNAKDGKKTVCLTFERKQDKNPDGTIKVLPVDQFSGRNFMLNEYGHPMNDIMAFETAQSDDIARQVLQRLKVFPVDKGDGFGDDLDSRFAHIVPANWCSPAEFVRAERHFAELAINQVNEQAPYSRQKIKDDDSGPVSDSNVVVADPE